MSELYLKKYLKYKKRYLELLQYGGDISITLNPNNNKSIIIIFNAGIRLKIESKDVIRSCLFDRLELNVLDIEFTSQSDKGILKSKYTITFKEDIHDKIKSIEKIFKEDDNTHLLKCKASPEKSESKPKPKPKNPNASQNTGIVLTPSTIVTQPLGLNNLTDEAFNYLKKPLNDKLKHSDLKPLDVKLIEDLTLMRKLISEKRIYFETSNEDNKKKSIDKFNEIIGIINNMSNGAIVMYNIMNNKSVGFKIGNLDVTKSEFIKHVIEKFKGFNELLNFFISNNIIIKNSSSTEDFDPNNFINVYAETYAVYLYNYIMINNNEIDHQLEIMRMQRKRR